MDARNFPKAFASTEALGTEALGRETTDPILSDDIVGAIARWSRHMQAQRNCRHTCMFGVPKTLASCAHCLEGRLRTINLYKHIPPEKNCDFLDAANRLRSWLLNLEARYDNFGDKPLAIQALSDCA